MHSRELLVTCAGLGIAVVIAGCMVAGFSALGMPSGILSSFLGPASGETPDYSPNRTITLGVTLPASPATVPSYRIISVESYTIPLRETFTVRKNIPSVEEAPALAKNALLDYGGLPPDAVLENTCQSFMGQYDTSRGVVTGQYPQYTRVRYRQYVNGSPVIGTGLSVELGGDGEMPGITKAWTVLEYTGDIPVISAEEAFEKLRAHELLNMPQCCIDDTVIIRVEPGYHVNNLNRIPSREPPLQDPCTPVWIFYGIKPGTDADPFPLLVRATRR
ncbi:MAG: hypothetical protein M0Q92_07545 [Methanoregula sp.]|jgi:hypothetical protein|nr:hypothetical protein [Methanoregula sp.]